MASPEADRKKVRALSGQAGSWVGMALQQGLDYVLTIGANNPPEKVAKRRDVVAALEHAASGGQDKALPILQQAWAAGIKSGGAKAADVDDSLLIDLTGDIERIMAAAAADMLNSYVIAGEEGLVKAQKRAAYRVSLAVDAAFTHARTAAKVSAAESSGMLKQWVTHSALPCSHCTHFALLPPIPVAAEFPRAVPGLPILTVYAKKFLGPPAHPSCACTLKFIKVGDSNG